MKPSLRVLGALALGLVASSLWETSAISASSAPPLFFWGHRFGSTSSDYGYSVASDATGGVIVTGAFNGTVNFGGADLVSAGGYEMFLAKYDVNGVHQWSKRFGGTNYDSGTSVAVDASGDVLVTGRFSSAVDFGGGSLASAGGTDIVLAKYDANGTHQWSKRFGGTLSDYSYSLAVTGAGNILLTGRFQGSVDFGGGNLASAGGYDVFLAQYDTNGTHQWSKCFGGTGSEQGNAVAVDGLGNVVVTGSFTATVNFGGVDLVSAGGSDIFVAKFDANGTHQWSKRFGDTTSDDGRGIAVDGFGNVFVTGLFNGTVDFGGGSLVSAGSADIFLAKYGANGTHLWSRRFGDQYDDFGHGVAATASGDVVTTGQLTDRSTFGSIIFLSRYDANGADVWSRTFAGHGDYGPDGIDTGYAVAVDNEESVSMTGWYEGTTMDFGGGNLASAGGPDIFVAKFGPYAAEPAITSIVDVPGDQGGWVRGSFFRSGFDFVGPAFPVSHYGVWRRVDDVSALSPLQGVAQSFSGADHDMAQAFSGFPLSVHEGRILAQSSPQPSTTSLPSGTWELVADVPALQSGPYLVPIHTLADSTNAGIHQTVLVVTAHTTKPSTWFVSAPDSGYSVDNLAPGVPGGLMYYSGRLFWLASAAKDFDYFTVYGANSDSFGAATVVGYTVMDRMDVSASPYVFYYVTATDFSGNEGNPAKVNTLSDVGGTPTSYVLSVSNYPNPFNPRTTVRYTVPSPGHVTVSIFDARGAHVATLFDGDRNAGAFSVDWDGRAAGASVAASGVYFARIEHASGTRSKKMVMLK